MARRTVPPGRLRRRLTIAYVLVAGASAAALAIGSYLMVSQSMFNGSLRQSTVDARYQLLLARDRPLDAEHRTELLTAFEQIERHVLLVTGDASTPSDARFTAALEPGVRADAAAGQLVYQRFDRGASAAGAPNHLLIVGGRIPGSTAELYLVRAEDGIYDDLSRLRTALLAGWVLVVAGAALVGRVLARRTLEPVSRASEAANAIAEGLLDTRLPGAGRDEFGAWASAFNRMAEALEAKIVALSAAKERESRFTADVAHELRTPVTALVAEASLLSEHLDALPDEARRPAELLVADVVRLRRLVEELMELSRLDAGQEDVSVRPIDLNAVVHAIVDTRGWGDRVELTGGPVTVSTDPRRLERVLANLIANAVEHGGSGVRVTVQSDREAARVRVTDSGPGIPAEQLPRLFDRFYKAEVSRSGPGSGLGLAIAQENARLLGAQLQVHSEVGVGTEFMLILAGGPS